jgi:hypothetical protein
MTFSLHRTKKSLQCNILKGGAIMRALGRLVAVAAILLFVLGLKAVVPTTEADARVGQNPTMNVLQMQQDYVTYLHVLNVHDMTFALD